MFVPSLLTVAISPPPIPPTPIPATFTRSLGGVCPTPPSTCRDTMVKPNAVAAVADRNFRREERNGSFVEGLRCFMTWIPSSGKRFQLGHCRFAAALSPLRRASTTMLAPRHFLTQLAFGRGHSDRIVVQATSLESWISGLWWSVRGKR